MMPSDSDNHMEPCLLKLSVQNDCLRVNAGDRFAVSGQEGDSIDVGEIYHRLCSNYTERLLEEFSGLFDRDELSIFSNYGIDARSVECDLLKGVYNRIAFDYLLTEEIMKEVRPLALKYRRVSISGVEGVYGVKQRLLLLYLRPEHPGKFSDGLARLVRKTGFMLAAYSALSVAVVVSIYAVMLSMLRGERTELDGITGRLFLLHSDMDNRVSHLMPELTADNGLASGICLLGAGLKRPQPVSTGAANKCVIRPWCRKKILSAVLIAIRAWPVYSRLLQRIAAQFKYQPAYFPLMVHSAMCLIRGQLHKFWVNNSMHPGVLRPVALGWSGWSDVTEFDLALQQRGIVTVHYLHGIIGDPVGYWGVSSKCVCKTQADVELLTATRAGYYGEIVAASCNSPARYVTEAVDLGENKTILVVTNLLHPANYRYRGIAEDRESRLLEIVAASCKSDWELVWRPHPYERNNVNAFPRVAAVAHRLGFKQDCKTALPQQLGHAGLVLTMFSSVLSDIIMSGKVPYFFAGLPYEGSPGWNGIDDALKFSSSDELSEMLEPGKYQSLAREHFSGLYNLFCYSRSV